MSLLIKSFFSFIKKIITDLKLWTEVYVWNENIVLITHKKIQKKVATKNLICTTVFVKPWENIKIWEGGLKVKSLTRECLCICISPKCVWLARSLFEEDYCWLTGQRNTTEPLIKHVRTHTHTTSCWCPYSTVIK